MFSRPWELLLAAEFLMSLHPFGGFHGGAAVCTFRRGLRCVVQNVSDGAAKILRWALRRSMMLFE